MNYREAVSDAMVDALQRDPKVILLGQNVTVPHGVFGTTVEAFRRFPERVLETPVSETMITGACVGLAMEGYKPVLVHCRADFSLFSFEHLINTAAKLPFLHGKPLPFVMRCVVGRGWGQGPVHSQSFHQMLAEVPGLDVVIPALPFTYAGHLRRGLEGERATIIYEPRRLFDATYGQKSTLAVYEPADLTIVAIGDTILEGISAIAILRRMGLRVNCHVWERISEPLKIRGRILLLDIVPRRPEKGVVSPPFNPLGVSAPLEKAWYPTTRDIVEAACKMLGKEAPPREETAHERDGIVLTSAF